MFYYTMQVNSLQRVACEDHEVVLLDEQTPTGGRRPIVFTCHDWLELQ